MAGMVVVSSADKPQLRLCLLDRLDEFGRGPHLHPVDHLDVRALPHHRHQILADVVQISFHSADHGGVFRLTPATRSKGSSHLELPSFMARAAINISGTKISFCLKRSPTIIMPGTRRFSRIEPALPRLQDTAVTSRRRLLCAAHQPRPA